MNTRALAHGNLRVHRTRNRHPGLLRAVGVKPQGRRQCRPPSGSCRATCRVSTPRRCLARPIDVAGYGQFGRCHRGGCLHCPRTTPLPAPFADPWRLPCASVASAYGSPCCRAIAMIPSASARHGPLPWYLRCRRCSQLDSRRARRPVPRSSIAPCPSDHMPRRHR